MLGGLGSGGTVVQGDSDGSLALGFIAPEGGGESLGLLEGEPVVVLGPPMRLDGRHHLLTAPGGTQKRAWPLKFSIAASTDPR